jgi:hypothetical protein
VKHLFSILRWIAILQVLAVTFQAVCAGQFLAGAEGPVRLHELGGWSIAILAAIQLALGLFSVRADSAPLWIPISCAVILLAALLQIGTGYGRFPVVHIPLGVILFGAVLCQALWLYREPQKGSAWG